MWSFFKRSAKNQFDVKNQFLSAKTQFNVKIVCNKSDKTYDTCIPTTYEICTIWTASNSIMWIVMKVT